MVVSFAEPLIWTVRGDADSYARIIKDLPIWPIHDHNAISSPRGLNRQTFRLLLTISQGQPALRFTARLIEYTAEDSEARPRTKSHEEDLPMWSGSQALTAQIGWEIEAPSAPARAVQYRLVLEVPGVPDGETPPQQLPPVQIQCVALDEQEMRKDDLPCL